VIRAIISWVVFFLVTLSVSTVSIVCVETDFGSGLMGSQPNQTSAADSYPLDGSIDNL
jgi:hypothetical protein